MKLASPPSPAPSAPSVDLVAAVARNPDEASTPRDLGAFEGWSGFVRILLWATRANRRG